MRKDHHINDTISELPLLLSPHYHHNATLSILLFSYYCFQATIQTLLSLLYHPKIATICYDPHATGPTLPPPYYWPHATDPTLTRSHLKSQKGKIAIHNKKSEKGPPKKLYYHTQGNQRDNVKEIQSFPRKDHKKYNDIRGPLSFLPHAKVLTLPFSYNCSHATVTMLPSHHYCPHATIPSPCCHPHATISTLVYCPCATIPCYCLMLLYCPHATIQCYNPHVTVLRLPSPTYHPTPPSPCYHPHTTISTLTSPS